MNFLKAYPSHPKNWCLLYVLLLALGLMSEEQLWAQGETPNAKALGGRLDLPDISLISVMSYAHYTAPKEHISKSGHDP